MVLDNEVHVVAEENLLGKHVVDVVDGADGHGFGSFANGTADREAQTVKGLVLRTGAPAATPSPPLFERNVAIAGGMWLIGAGVEDGRGGLPAYRQLAVHSTTGKLSRSQWFM
jgi:hypothetical protein